MSSFTLPSLFTFQKKCDRCVQRKSCQNVPIFVIGIIISKNASVFVFIVANVM